MDPERRFHLRRIALWTAIIALGHFLLGTTTHAIHGVHIVLGGLFLVPILIAAVAFEVRGALLAALAASMLYLAHVIWSWRDSPLRNADQYAIVGVYFVVAVAAGRLVQTANFRRWQRDEVIRRSRQSEMIQGLSGLLSALGARSAATLAHCRAVSDLSVRVGKALDVDRERLDRLRLAALVHDIGKIGIPDDILFRAGALSEEQTGAMREHVTLAVEMLRAIPGTEEIAGIVLAHHECPDGSGYPGGLAGEEIPIEARALRVADVFVALTEKRPYHEPLGNAQAIAAMRAWVGSRLDAQAFAALERVVQAEHDATPGRPDDRRVALPGGAPA